jgi:hypothetical protein
MSNTELKEKVDSIKVTALQESDREKSQLVNEVWEHYFHDRVWKLIQSEVEAAEMRGFQDGKEWMQCEVNSHDSKVSIEVQESYLDKKRELGEKYRLGDEESVRLTNFRIRRYIQSTWRITHKTNTTYLKLS